MLSQVQYTVLHFGQVPTKCSAYTVVMTLNILCLPGPHGTTEHRLSPGFWAHSRRDLWSPSEGF